MLKNETRFEITRRATLAKIYSKPCLICGTIVLMAKNQKYCSPQCKGKVQYVNGRASTENQYISISGDWKRYVSRLLYYGGRKRDKLSQEILLKKLKDQNYLCALTGELLTCSLKKGVICRTNASVDRIIPGGPYTEDNIQIVCRAVNYWRSDLTVQEFVDWCQKVATHNHHQTSNIRPKCDKLS